MKIKFDHAITISKRYNDWVFAITPCIYICRSDVFASEACFYINVRWLVFQVYIQIITKKKES